MELELGLKITRTRDDISNFSNLQIAKDQTGPVFLSRETETMFILIVYLKGFRRENIDIKINEDGTQIEISGRKPVQEMVLTGWMMHKKDVELRAFRKVFKIPDGIILDRIKAKFSSEDATLTITMQKLVKGVCGFVIEEVKEAGIRRVEGKEGTPDVDEGPEELQREPKAKRVEEIEQVVRKEIDGLESKVTKVVTDQIPGKEKGKEALIQDTAEPMIEREVKPSQVEEQVVDQKQFETEKELPEEAKTGDGYKEDGEIMEEKVDGVSKNISEEIVPHIELERDEGEETRKPRKKDSLESKAAPEMAEPHVFSSATPEEANMKPEECVRYQEIEHPQMSATPTAEETRAEDKNGNEQKSQQADNAGKEKLEERIHGSESLESTEPKRSQVSQETEAPQPSSVQAKEEHITEHQEGTKSLHAPENQIIDTTIEEAIKPEPDKEKEQAETPHPADELQDVNASEEAQVEEHDHRQEEIHENEETRDQEEFQEERELSERQAPESPAEEETNKTETNETTSSVHKRRKKLCPPLVIAGSAILISLIVLFNNLIRAKKQ